MRRPPLVGMIAAVAALAMLTVGAHALSGRGSADAARTDRPSTTATRAADRDALRPGSASSSAPVRVSVPRLDISSRLDRLALEPGGGLEKPPRWQVAGWYAAGPRPGDVGPAVIAGHVDSPTGPAIFARLSEVRAGDRITIRTADGEDLRFRVDRTLSAPKRAFPTRAVYGPTPDSQLRLITCDGAYDKSRDGYQDNLVVFATEVRR